MFSSLSQFQYCLCAAFPRCGNIIAVVRTQLICRYESFPSQLSSAVLRFHFGEKKSLFLLLFLCPLTGSSLSLSHSHSRMVSKHQLSLGRIETRVQERAVPRGRKCVSSSSSFSLSSSPGPHFLVCFPGKGTRAQIRARARLFQPLSPRSNGDPPNNVVWNDARASPNSKSYLHF